MKKDTNIEETKEEKFCRIAEYRTNKIIDMLRLLGNCSNRSTYSYDDAQVEQIFKAITQATESAKSRFESEKESKPFRLKKP